MTTPRLLSRDRKTTPGPELLPRPSPAPVGYGIQGAISIHQPWAWLVVNGYKTFENRPTNIARPGLYYVHASKTPKVDEWNAALVVAGRNLHREEVALIPALDEIEAGGIIGVMELGSWSPCMTPDVWSFGSGYRIKWAAPAEDPTPCRGYLGVFQPQATVHHICTVCGCTDSHCERCIQRTGSPCSWVDDDHTLCSACANAIAIGSEVAA